MIPAIRLVEETAEARTPRRKRTKNLIVRNGVYYFRAMIHGKLYHESLDTPDQAVAVARAKVKRNAIESGKWENLEATRKNSDVATIGALCDAYLEATRMHGRPRRETAQGAVGSLLIVVRDALGLASSDAARSQSCMVISDKLALDFGRVRIPVDADRETLDRARRTVYSTLNQARSVFGSRWRGAYRAAGIRIPDPKGFLDEYVCDNPMRDWVEPTADEMAPILENGPKLKDTFPALYPVWLLAFHLALRAGEMARIRWTWFEERDGRIWMHDKARPEEGYIPKGDHEGWVPVSAAVWAELQALRRDDPHVVPGGSLTARKMLIERTFAQWMRGLGWTRRHTAHELRAYRGNLWRKERGTEVMRDWLRHRTVSVGMKHYSSSYNPAQVVD